MLLFKLTALLKILDTAIDMTDGRRYVRSAKYELPVFTKTKKIYNMSLAAFISLLLQKKLNQLRTKR